MSIIDAIVGQHWAIKRGVLPEIIKIGLRKNEDWNVLAGKMGKPTTYTYKARQHGNVGVIPITGPIFPKANMMTEYSGGTSLNLVSHDLAMFVDSPEIKAIVLEIDSPGGVAFGPGEFAEEVRKAAGKKPVIAYVSGMACSAAYWIAAAATEIVAHKTAMLGSIGVVTSAGYQQEPNSEGEMYVEIVSSNAENKRPDPREEEGKAEIRRELDAIENEFIQSISIHRGVTREHILSSFGRGGVLISDEAVRVGMADRQGSFEDLLSELSTSSHFNTMKGKTMEKTTASGPAEPTSGNNQPAAANVDTAAIEAAATAKGAAEGAAAERARILGIQDVMLAGNEEMAKAAIADGKTTPEQFAFTQAKAEKAKGGGFMNSMLAEAAQQPKVEPAVDPALATPEKAPAADAPIEDRAEHEWNSDEKIRTEFRSKKAYLSFRRAEEAGRVKVLSKK